MQGGNTGFIGKGVHDAEEHGLLFEYSLKFLLLAGFLELVLYRLVSRLGMHLGKLAEKYEAVRLTFRGLSSLGFMLLNVTSILVFLVIFILLFQKLRHTILKGNYDKILIPSFSILVLLTLTYLVFPPAMLGTVMYNVISFIVLSILVAEYMATHRVWAQRIMVGCYFLGVCGWLYYQTLTTTYGLMGLLSAPPLVHAVNRVGEAMMVLASILVFWAYGSTPILTKNRRQRRRAITLVVSGGVVFLSLLFLDYFLSLYNPETAEGVRKAGEGIGWIFQMGMGYTFYLPFAFYVTGLICWSYTVVKLVIIGRIAGFGLGLMFIAGYALQLSHLTLMVVLGMMLLNLDKRGTFGKLRENIQDKMAYQPISAALGQSR